MAELEILEALVGLFCPTNEAASTCREFISNHSQVLPPIGPLFYFLLFPIVFTILFIYILSSTILHGGNLTKGMRLLIGISVFIFIIISGWYPVMLVLSEFWFIMIIVLFGAWYFIGKHRGGGGGGSGGKGGALYSLPFGGVVEYGKERIKKLGADTPAERLVKSHIEIMEGVLTQMDGAKDDRARSTFSETFSKLMNQFEHEDLPEIEKTYGVAIHNYIAKKYRPTIEYLKRKFQEQRKK